MTKSFLKLNKQMEQTLQESNFMKDKKGELQATIGSIEARKRLMLKSLKQKQLMDKNIGMSFILTLSSSSLCR
jgi:hypothetical protein